MEHAERHPLDRAMRTRVLEELVRIERERNVKVLYACESGSRAWGFSSTDSDYDVRFVYVEKPDWFIQVSEARDVIERPLDDELDISGWELRKTLGLLQVQPDLARMARLALGVSQRRGRYPVVA